jgi:hypothetical protein
LALSDFAPLITLEAIPKTLPKTTPILISA